MTEDLKKIYEEGIKEGFIKNLTFKKWLKIWYKMDKEIKEINKKEKEHLNRLSKAIKEAQEIIYKKGGLK